MSKRKKTEDEPLQGTWLNTYGDLVTLLLCFFVLLFSMSTVDNIKFKQLLLSFGTGSISYISDNDGSNSFKPEDIKEVEDNSANQKIDENEEKKFKEIESELGDFVTNNALNSNVTIFGEKEGVLIRFNDSVLFEKGSAELKEDSIQILTKMATLLHKYERKVRVEGHTDNDPIKSVIYPSNWELSTARATNVIRLFIEGVPENIRINPVFLQAAGYGEQCPIAENTDEGNKSKNRRIEIMILKNE